MRGVWRPRCRMPRLCTKASSHLSFVDPASSRVVEASNRLQARHVDLERDWRRKVAAAEYWRKPFQSVSIPSKLTALLRDVDCFSLLAAMVRPQPKSTGVHRAGYRRVESLCCSLICLAHSCQRRLGKLAHGRFGHPSGRGGQLQIMLSLGLATGTAAELQCLMHVHCGVLIFSR